MKRLPGPVRAALLTVLAVGLLRAFVFELYRVPTPSMAPGLLPGDRILALRPAYGLRVPGTPFQLGSLSVPSLHWVVSWPARGDVVVLADPKHPGGALVKRVIGIEGDRIEVREGALWWNEVELPRRLLRESGAVLPGYRPAAVYEEELYGVRYEVALPEHLNDPSFGPHVVAPGRVFVMGDYRDHSTDSRRFGDVPVRDVLGRVLGVVTRGGRGRSRRRRGIGANLPDTMDRVADDGDSGAVGLVRANGRP